MLLGYFWGFGGISGVFFCNFRVFLGVFLGFFGRYLGFFWGILGGISGGIFW